MESGDAPPAESSLDSVFHKRARDSKSFKLVNVVLAGPNKPHSVYFTAVSKKNSAFAVAFGKSAKKKNMTDNGNY